MADFSLAPLRRLMEPFHNGTFAPAASFLVFSPQLRYSLQAELTAP